MNTGVNMKVAIANDHGGYDLKNWVMENFSLDGVDIEWIDLGSNSTESVDYPDFGFKMADVIEKGEADYGVAICGSGIGISMALNRNKAVRAAVCVNDTMARLTRIDNNANVICLGARLVGTKIAEDCLRAFFTTEFETGGRHERRVNKLG